MPIVKTNIGSEMTNIDEALMNFAALNYQSGIFMYKLNESEIFLVASNVIGIKTGELCITGFRVQIDEQQLFTFTTAPVSDTDYELIAKITVNSDKTVDFDLFYRIPTALTHDNIFYNGTGEYELKLATFTHTTENEIDNLVQTVGFIGE